MTQTISPPLILAFGDSLTAGYGLRAEHAFPARLEALLAERRPGARVVNAGLSGETSAGGRARLPRVLAGLAARPDLAILELGANDLIRGLPAGATAANLRWIVEEFGRCGIPVLLAGMRAPAFLGAAAERFNAVFPDLARAMHIPLYPSFLAGVAGRPGLVLADGFHPNAAAIAIVAARILPHVEAALDRVRAPA
jgi:acyl-CoA thioesterase-1